MLVEALALESWLIEQLIYPFFKPKPWSIKPLPPGGGGRLSQPISAPGNVLFFLMRELPTCRDPIEISQDRCRNAVDRSIHKHAFTLTSIVKVEMIYCNILDLLFISADNSSYY
jgi:hypothetical protein